MHLKCTRHAIGTHMRMGNLISLKSCVVPYKNEKSLCATFFIVHELEDKNANAKGKSTVFVVQIRMYHIGIGALFLSEVKLLTEPEVF